MGRAHLMMYSLLDGTITHYWITWGCLPLVFASPSAGVVPADQRLKENYNPTPNSRIPPASRSLVDLMKSWLTHKLGLLDP